MSAKGDIDPGDETHGSGQDDEMDELDILDEIGDFDVVDEIGEDEEELSMDEVSDVESENKGGAGSKKDTVNVKQCDNQDVVKVNMKRGSSQRLEDSKNSRLQLRSSVTVKLLSRDIMTKPDIAPFYAKLCKALQGKYKADKYGVTEIRLHGKEGSEEANNKPDTIGKEYQSKSTVNKPENQQNLRGLEEGILLIVSNISPEVRPEMLKSLFPYARHILLPRSEAGCNIGFAILETANKQEAAGLVRRYENIQQGFKTKNSKSMLKHQSECSKKLDGTGNSNPNAKSRQDGEDKHSMGSSLPDVQLTGTEGNTSKVEDQDHPKQGSRFKDVPFPRGRGFSRGGGAFRQRGSSFIKQRGVQHRGAFHRGRGFNRGKQQGDRGFKRGGYSWRGRGFQHQKRPHDFHRGRGYKHSPAGNRKENYHPDGHPEDSYPSEDVWRGDDSPQYAWDRYDSPNHPTDQPFHEAEEEWGAEDDYYMGEDYEGYRDYPDDGSQRERDWLEEEARWLERRDSTERYSNEQEDSHYRDDDAARHYSEDYYDDRDDYCDYDQVPSSRGDHCDDDERYVDDNWDSHQQRKRRRSNSPYSRRSVDGYDRYDDSAQDQRSASHRSRASWERRSNRKIIRTADGEFLISGSSNVPSERSVSPVRQRGSGRHRQEHFESRESRERRVWNRTPDRNVNLERASPAHTRRSFTPGPRSRHSQPPEENVRYSHNREEYKSRSRSPDSHVRPFYSPEGHVRRSQTPDGRYRQRDSPAPEGAIVLTTTSDGGILVSTAPSLPDNSRRSRSPIDRHRGRRSPSPDPAPGRPSESGIAVPAAVSPNPSGILLTRTLTGDILLASADTAPVQTALPITRDTFTQDKGSSKGSHTGRSVRRAHVYSDNEEQHREQSDRILRKSRDNHNRNVSRELSTSPYHRNLTPRRTNEGAIKRRSPYTRHDKNLYDKGGDDLDYQQPKHRRTKYENSDEEVRTVYSSKRSRSRSQTRTPDRRKVGDNRPFISTEQGGRNSQFGKISDDERDSRYSQSRPAYIKSPGKTRSARNNDFHSVDVSSEARGSGMMHSKKKKTNQRNLEASFEFIDSDDSESLPEASASGRRRRNTRWQSTQLKGDDLNKSSNVNPNFQDHNLNKNARTNTPTRLVRVEQRHGPDSGRSPNKLTLTRTCDASEQLQAPSNSQRPVTPLGTRHEILAGNKAPANHRSPHDTQMSVGRYFKKSGSLRDTYPSASDNSTVAPPVNKQQLIQNVHGGSGSKTNPSNTVPLGSTANARMIHPSVSQNSSYSATKPNAPQQISGNSKPGSNDTPGWKAHGGKVFTQKPKWNARKQFQNKNPRRGGHNFQSANQQQSMETDVSDVRKMLINQLQLLEQGVQTDPSAISNIANQIKKLGQLKKQQGNVTASVPSAMLDRLNAGNHSIRNPGWTNTNVTMSSGHMNNQSISNQSQGAANQTWQQYPSSTSYDSGTQSYNSMSRQGQSRNTGYVGGSSEGFRSGPTSSSRQPFPTHVGNSSANFPTDSQSYSSTPVYQTPQPNSGNVWPR